MFSIANAQIEPNLPNITLKNLDGESFTISQINNNGKPYILELWTYNCTPARKEIIIWAKHYDKWVSDTGVKVFTVCILEENNSINTIKSFVESKNLQQFEVLLDIDKELAKALNITMVPMFYLFDGQGNIVFQKAGFSDGDEELLYQELLKLKIQ